MIGILVVISAILFAIQMIIFRSPRDTAFYLFQDMAFLPLEVALVTIVLGKAISDREKRSG